MSSDQYTPSEGEVRADFVLLHTRNFDSYMTGRSLTSEQEHYGDQFDRFLARVRRDAAREALDGLAEAMMDTPGIGPGTKTHRARMRVDVVTYRDRNYPEETP